MPGFRRLPTAQKLLLAAGSLILLGAGAYMLFTREEEVASPISEATQDEKTQAVREHVEAFGGELQNVFVLAPDASAQIETRYSSYVDPTLLGFWSDNPEYAPGRLTSSPWPARIEIVSVKILEGDIYIVEGKVVEATSAGDTPVTYPIILAVQSKEGGWRITDFQTLAPPTRE